MPAEDSNNNEIALQMASFDSSVHEHIGDYRKAVVREGPLNDATLYHDAMFDSIMDDDVTFPWDTKLEELALSDQTTDSIAQLDEYMGAQLIFPGKNGEGEVLAKVHRQPQKRLIWKTYW